MDQTAVAVSLTRPASRVGAERLRGIEELRREFQSALTREWPWEARAYTTSEILDRMAQVAYDKLKPRAMHRVDL